MKSFLRRRVSPGVTLLASLILAALMVLADADATSCFVALIFLLAMTDRRGSCRHVRRERL